MIGAIKVTQPTWNFAMFAKTISNSSTWRFDRFRLSGPKWYTRIQVRRPDGSVLGEQMFNSEGSYEHNFSFDLSENINNEEYEIYIGGIPTSGNYFQQVYAYPSGYSATTGENALITYWDFNIVNVGGSTVYNQDGRIKWENQPINTVLGLHKAVATKWYIQNSQWTGAMIDELLIGLYNNAVDDPNNTKEINYSGNPGVPTNASKEAYDWLISVGWNIIGQAPPQDIVYEAETTSFMNATGTPDDSNASIYTGLTNHDCWILLNEVISYWKTQGVWSDIIHWHPMFGGTAVKHSYNVKNVADYQMTWFGSWIHSTTGNKANGLNTYAKFGFTPSTFYNSTTEDIGISLVTLSEGSGASEIEVGGRSDLSSRFQFGTKYTDKAISLLGDGAVQSSAASGVGIFTTTKNSSNTVNIFRNKIELISVSLGGGISSTESAYGASNTEGTIGLYSNKEIADVIHHYSTDPLIIQEGLRMWNEGLGRLAIT